MRNDEMAKRAMSWVHLAGNPTLAALWARNLAEKSGDKFYHQVADSILAKGENRRMRRARKQAKGE